MLLYHFAVPDIHGNILDCGIFNALLLSIEAAESDTAEPHVTSIWYITFPVPGCETFPKTTTSEFICLRIISRTTQPTPQEHDLQLVNSSSRLSCSLYIAHHASHRLLRTSPLLRGYASVMPSHASPRLLSHIPPAIHHRPSAITSTACDSPSEIYAHAASKPSVAKTDYK